MRNNKGKNIISFCVIFMAMLVVGIVAFGERTVLAASQSETLVNYALSQVGTTERRGNSDSVIYNDWYGMGNVQWCHVFVSYCAEKSGIPTSIIPKTASCQAGVNWFKKRNRYHTRASGYVPKKGDIIYMATTSGS